MYSHYDPAGFVKFVTCVYFLSVTSSNFEWINIFLMNGCMNISVGLTGLFWLWLLFLFFGFKKFKQIQKTTTKTI